MIEEIYALIVGLLAISLLVAVIFSVIVMVDITLRTMRQFFQSRKVLRLWLGVCIYIFVILYGSWVVGRIILG